MGAAAGERRMGSTFIIMKRLDWSWSGADKTEKAVVMLQIKDGGNWGQSNGDNEH